MTLAEVVIRNPAAAEIFEDLNIDYFCRGSRLLGDVLNESNVMLDAFTGELARVAAPNVKQRPEPDWQILPLRNLIKHIVDKHHAYLHSELPALDRLIGRMTTESPIDDVPLVKLHKTIQRLKRELELQMRKEEAILFPAISDLEVQQVEVKGHLWHIRYPLEGVTFDADICPARDSSNLEALASALWEMKARIRAPDVPEGLPFSCDATFLAGVDLLNLVTRFGDLDLAFTPSGTGGYADLSARAVEMPLEGMAVPVAALEDVIRSKEAANRPKDQRALPLLKQRLAEIHARRDREGG
jgi:iron-sulfur cluster repair di-iron protein